MKKILLLIIATFITSYIFSQEVNIDLAKRVAKNFYLKEISRNIIESGKDENSNITNTITWQYNEHNSYYIINFKGGGWVIVAAHKAKGPVLAYSNTGNIQEDLIPSAFLVLMNPYDVIIDSAYKNSWIDDKKLQKWNELEDSSKIYSTLKSSGIYPDYMIKTKWGQGRYPDCGYNTLMPYCDACNAPCNMNNYCYHNCMAGCGAVAIAQILNYWGYATGSYADFDWWEMEEVGYAPAIPYLLKRCGDRLGMQYCSDGCSSSFSESETVMKAALRDFGYKEDEIEYKEKTFLISYDNWLDMIKEEIIAGYPVYYGVPLHSIVCDGYNSSNGNFHWNFGFNGICDGWVDVEDMVCSQCSGDIDNLNAHTATIGIRPNINFDIVLNNIIINTGSSDPWPNKQTYQAKNSISVAGDNSYFTINSNAECRLVAGNSINLKPGFHVVSGGRFNTKLYYKADDKKSISVGEAEDNTHSLGEAINQPLVKDDFLIYPNPTTTNITIESANSDLVVSQIIILNSTGRATIQSNEKFKKIYEINLANLPKGIYLVKIIYNNSSYSKLLIKQ